MFDRGDILKALKTWITAVEVGSRCLPEEFIKSKGRLEWRWIENRPFLRANKGLGCCFSDLGEFDGARLIFNNLLAMNPNDNQQVRALAIKTAFAMGDPGRCELRPAVALIFVGCPLEGAPDMKGGDGQQAEGDGYRELPGTRLGEGSDLERDGAGHINHGEYQYPQGDNAFLHTQTLVVR